MNPINGVEDVLFLGYGFVNGVINVFPENSLPQFCRSNITQTWSQAQRLFIDMVIAKRRNKRGQNSFEQRRFLRVRRLREARVQ